MVFKPHKTSISKLVCGDHNGSIVARVIRKWWRTDDEKPDDCKAVELILLDEENDTIHMTLDSKQLWIFSYDTFIEGEAYVISKFIVGPNTYKLKVTGHKLRLYIAATTKVTKLESCTISRNKYNMVNFNDIIHDNVPRDCFIDVVAEVVNYNPIWVSKEKGKSYTTVNLRDTRGDDLVCVIYGKYTDIIRSICSFYTNKTKRPVVAIQYVKRGSWDKKECIVTNRGATRFIVNPDIPEAAGLYARIQAEKLAGTPSSLTYRAGHCNDLFWEPNLKTIAEIRNTNKAGDFLTVATFTDLPQQHAWYFNACITCRGTAVKGYSGEWICKNLQCSVNQIPQQKVNQRYLVIYGVRDANDTYAEVKLFENHIKLLVKEPASKLIKDINELPTRQPFPPHLLRFIEKRALIKLHVSRDHNLATGNKIYTVVAISFESQDINLWQSMYNDLKGKGKTLEEQADDELWKDLEEVAMTLNAEDSSVIDHTVIRNPDPNSSIIPYMTKQGSQAESSEAKETTELQKGETGVITRQVRLPDIESAIPSVVNHNKTTNSGQQPPATSKDSKSTCPVGSAFRPLNNCQRPTTAEQEDTVPVIVQGLQTERADKSIRVPRNLDSSNSRKTKVKHVAFRKVGVNARNATQAPIRTDSVSTQATDPKISEPVVEQMGVNVTKSTNPVGPFEFVSTEATDPKESQVIATQPSQCVNASASIARKLFVADTPLARRVIEVPAPSLNDLTKTYTLKRKAQEKNPAVAGQPYNIGPKSSQTYIGDSTKKNSTSKITIGPDGKPINSDADIQRIVKIKQEKISPPKGK